MVILQHPRERHVPVNTVRIASLCLPEAETHVGVDWTSSAVLDRVLADSSRPAALLYPGPEAVDVEEHPPPGPITLVVVDGTWWQARKVVRSNPALAALPRYAFRPRVPSQYRIRAEPHDDYVSTIEALVHVLGVLEGDPERYAAMLVPFRAMVDRQVEYSKHGGGRARVRKPRALAARARNPSAQFLEEHFDDLVCVHAEANAWPYDSAERARYGDELVEWLACRVATGETMRRFVTPRGALAPNTLHHLALDPSVLSDATRAASVAEVLEQWRAFSRPSDVVCAWGTYAPRLFEAAGGALPIARVDVRDAARRHAGRKVGTMLEFLTALGASAPSADEGRGAERLTQLVAITRALAGAAP